MPSLSLTFDPQYVIAALDAWREQGVTVTPVLELERETTKLLRQRFTERNEMGMREQTVAPAATTKAIGVLTSLNLAKKSSKGKGEARVVLLLPTSDGRQVLSEIPTGHVVYPQFAARLSSAPSDLQRLLGLLESHGPFSQPVMCVTSDAPRRGAAHKALGEEGLREYRRQARDLASEPTVPYEPTSAKATLAQQIKAAQAWAAQAHPAGRLKQLDKAVTIGLAFGLLWVDTAQINEVIGAKTVGLASTRTALGYRPNVLRWPDDSGAFTQALVTAIVTRSNGSGFATVQEVRGAIGRKLNLSPSAVDALLRETRDAGDRHEIPIELHFEPDEDQLYASQRDPLVWRHEAFEFITLLRSARAR